MREKMKKRKRKIPYYNQRPIDLRGLDLMYEERKLKASTFLRPQRAKEREVYNIATININLSELLRTKTKESINEYKKNKQFIFST